MSNSFSIDIKENEILEYDNQLLSILLADNSSKKNIIWATPNYEPLGTLYKYNKEITPELISGENGTVIRPRVNKTRDEQISRIRDKAEVFTPSWVCNKQNNSVDDAWFGRKNVFNVETLQGWKNNVQKIAFPTQDGKSWQDYVEDVRLEVSCGEAPYLTSRYDTITGSAIAPEDRIGFLDRKLRIVSENTELIQEWVQWATIAVQSIYGYEWQGDNLVLARENILYTYIDFYEAKFAKKPTKTNLRQIAKIISWNIWQMDGLKGVIPFSCKTTVLQSRDLFGELIKTSEGCEGCKRNDFYKHNGCYCKIKDWKTGKTIKYISLLNKYGA